MKLNKKGVTLLELLAVLVVLAIISAIAFPSVSRVIENTRKSALISNSQTIANALELYCVTNSLTDPCTGEGFFTNVEGNSAGVLIGDGNNFNTYFERLDQNIEFGIMVFEGRSIIAIHQTDSNLAIIGNPSSFERRQVISLDLEDGDLEIGDFVRVNLLPTTWVDGWPSD